MEKQLNYKEAMEEMETIVGKIEENKYEVDELCEAVKRVSELINFCKAKLKNTEEEIDKILDTIE